MTKTFTVKFQRYSKNYAVYGTTDGGVIANIYLPKHELGANPPQQLRVGIYPVVTEEKK